MRSGRHDGHCAEWISIATNSIIDLVHHVANCWMRRIMDYESNIRRDRLGQNFPARAFSMLMPLPDKEQCMMETNHCEREPDCETRASLTNIRGRSHVARLQS